MSSALDKLSIDYENIILLGNLNVEVEEENLSNFMSVHNFQNLVKTKNLF